MNSCVFCDKKIEEYLNYCNWQCHLDDAEKQGGIKIIPNNLPIACVKANGDMLEHEHGDHPDYIFPVEVEYIGNENEGIDNSDHINYIYNETHALIYHDRSMALTIYECNYSMWSLIDGAVMGGRYREIGDWKLSYKSLEKIRCRQ